MNYSLSTNHSDFNYSAFWHTRLKSKADKLKKVSNFPHFKSLNVIANCYGYKNWSSLLESERIQKTSYFPHPLNISVEDLLYWQKKFNIPQEAIEIFSFTMPNRSDLRTGYIIDYLKSNSINAILPIFEDVRVLFRKFLKKDYNVNGKIVKGDFLYIEPHENFFDTNTTKYFIEILRDIWKEFPELKIHFSHFGIKNSCFFIDSTDDLDIDFLNWSQLPVVKTYQSSYFTEQEFYEYLILEPF